jgi:hypothetical protein
MDEYEYEFDNTQVDEEENDFYQFEYNNNNNHLLTEKHESIGTVFRYGLGECDDEDGGSEGAIAQPPSEKYKPVFIDRMVEVLTKRYPSWFKWYTVNIHNLHLRYDFQKIVEEHRVCPKQIFLINNSLRKNYKVSDELMWYYYHDMDEFYWKAGGTRRGKGLFYHSLMGLDIKTLRNIFSYSTFMGLATLKCLNRATAGLVLSETPKLLRNNKRVIGWNKVVYDRYASNVSMLVPSPSFLVNGRWMDLVYSKRTSPERRKVMLRGLRLFLCVFLNSRETIRDIACLFTTGEEQSLCVYSLKNRWDTLITSLDLVNPNRVLSERIYKFATLHNHKNFFSGVDYEEVLGFSSCDYKINIPKIINILMQTEVLLRDLQSSESIFESNDTYDLKCVLEMLYFSESNSNKKKKQKKKRRKLDIPSNWPWKQIEIEPDFRWHRDPDDKRIYITLNQTDSFGECMVIDIKTCKVISPLHLEPLTRLARDIVGIGDRLKWEVN